MSAAGQHLDAISQALAARLAAQDKEEALRTDAEWEALGYVTGDGAPEPGPWKCPHCGWELRLQAKENPS